MRLNVRADNAAQAEVTADRNGEVTIAIGNVTLVLREAAADQLVSDVMLAIARRDLGSPLLRDEETIRMNAFVRENL